MIKEAMSIAQYQADDLRKAALKEIDRWLRVAGDVDHKRIESVVTGIVGLYLQGYKQIMK